MAVTDTVGGATSGYQAIGIAGMASAPARTMTSEQTVARIGRRINVSTNIASALRGVRLRSARGVRLQAHRKSIADLLGVRHDDLIASLQSARDHVVVADDGANGDRLLLRDESLTRGLGHEHEMLAGETADGDDGYCERRLQPPDDAGADV